MSRNYEKEVEAAQRAAQSGIAELLAMQETKVMTRLLLSYRGGTLTPEEAKTGIAVISELRSLASSTERTIERGADAVTQMTKGTPQ